MMLARNDDISVRFLKLILPERGPYIAAIRNPRNRGFKPNEFAYTIEDLWTVIENADRDGCETYHACAAFKEARNDASGTPDGQKRFGRTKHNASGAKSFWLDIDVGTGKQYVTQQKALDALAVFCRTLNLPRPIVVSSGAGLHVYWPLIHTLDPDTWKRYAEGLKRLCAEHGLFADPVRTADISSVLRTVGTSNRKHGVARKVECDPKFLEIRPYAIECLSIFLEHEVTTPQKSSRKRRVAERLASIVTKHPQRLVKRLSNSADSFRGLAINGGTLPSLFGTLDSECWPSVKTATTWGTGGPMAILDTPTKRPKLGSTAPARSQGPQLASASTRSTPKSAKRAHTGKKLTRR
jgi:hypothetical protein